MKLKITNLINDNSNRMLQPQVWMDITNKIIKKHVDGIDIVHSTNGRCLLSIEENILLENKNLSETIRKFIGKFNLHCFYE